MRRALISDIHGNLEALETVMADIENRGIEEIYFLGDVVGYGPDPEKCIDIISPKCEIFLLGNHDDALLGKPIGFNPIAKKAIECIRERMAPKETSNTEEKARWEFLKTLQKMQLEENLMFVHASPRDYIFEYILPSHAQHERETLTDIFSRFDHLCFVGHSHLPGIMTEEPKFYTPAELFYEYQFQKDKKVVVNIGSVGQPRDKDPRSCYLEIDDNGCKWHRLEYNIQKTVDKVKSMSCLDERIGLRLLEGR
ncbi:MAG: metallophosphoesterase family protein [Planctomycetota bacterium]